MVRAYHAPLLNCNLKFEQPTNLGTTGTPLPPNEGGTGTSTVFTKGSVVFAGTSGVYSQDNSNFFYDGTNHRLGIGTATPSTPLHVVGLANNTSTTALFEQNASGIGIIQLGNASPSQNAQFIFNFSGDNSLSIKTNYSLGTQNAIAFSPGGTETVRFKQGGLNGFGTNAPTHTITLSSTSTGIAAYNTSDQTTNYQRVTSGWQSGNYEIGDFFGGIGSGAQIRIGNNGSGGTTIVNRYLGINSSNATTAAAFDFITTAVAYTSANALMTNLANTTFTASSGIQGIVGINPTITQTSTAGYQALWISPFEISTGSGVHYLIDAGTNSAANGSGTHTSKFNVDDTGAGSFASSLIVGSSITAGTTNSNIDISSSVSAITTAVSQYQFASSTTNFFRTGFYGNSPSVLSTGANYSGVMFAGAPIATFTSGTHSWLANVVVNPIGTITNNGATVTNTASLYIGGAGSGGTNNYSLAMAGTTGLYNNVKTTGWGTPAIYGYARPAAGQVGAVTLSTYTVGATDGSFLVSANILVTTATLHSFTVTCTYTDEGNTSRTLTLQLSTIAGAFITAITNAQGTVPYEGVPLHIRAKASTSITIATTGTFTTVVYNGEGAITQIA